MTRKSANWTRDELILALSVYFQLPFGRLNRVTPEVKELARIIGRSDNSAALRLVNFAACDPYIVNSGRSGMVGGLAMLKVLKAFLIINLLGRKKKVRSLFIAQLMALFSRLLVVVIWYSQTK